MIRFTNCIFANANSLVSRSKKYIFDHFMRDRRPDMVMQAEHKFSEIHRLEFEGFVVLDRTDKGRGGGTAILVKDSIGHKEGLLI